ncbi:MAG TPA: ABC transporter substrate-binding protein [Polyangiaceae bacterium]
MRLRHIVALSSMLGLLGLTAPAHAEDGQGFVEREHFTLQKLLHEPASAARDAQVNTALDGFVDYDELIRRAFGEPCHPTLPNCEDIWAGYDEAKRAEVHDLLKALLQKSYRKNLLKTLDWEVAYEGQRDMGSETRVITKAKSKLKPHDPPTRVDYIVKQTPSGWKVVEWTVEGSSVTKNYYDQFYKKMHKPEEGYANIVAKLREKVAKKD